MSTKEHCHGCDKLWSEESPECIFNYHKQPVTGTIGCGHSTIRMTNEGYKCIDCNKTAGVFFIND